MDHFGPKNGASSQLWISLKNLLQILHNKKDQQVDESNNNGLYPKKLVQDKWAILDWKWHILITLDQLKEFF